MVGDAAVTTKPIPTMVIVYADPSCSVSTEHRSYFFKKGLSSADGSAGATIYRGTGTASGTATMGTGTAGSGGGAAARFFLQSGNMKLLLQQ